MKNLKISDKAHRELKVFAANVNYSMSVLASDALISYVKAQTITKPKVHKKRTS